LLQISHANLKPKSPKWRIAPQLFAAIIKSGIGAAEINTITDSNKHPLYLNYECPDIITLLVGAPSSSTANLGIRDPKHFALNCPNGMTFIHTQILFDHAENLAAYYAATHADVNNPFTHQLPLMYCARTNALKCATLLLGLGADVNKEHDDSRPIDYAVHPYGGWSKKRVEMVKLLVDAGAELDHRDKDSGKTLIERCANADARGYIVEAVAKRVGKK
jgi:hypothetical protein